MQETHGVEKIPWKREWQPTPVFLPGEFHRERSLIGYSSWGCKELDTTEQLTLSDLHFLKESVQFPLRSLHSLTEMSSCFGQKLHQLSLIIAINSGWPESSLTVTCVFDLENERKKEKKKRERELEKSTHCFFGRQTSFKHSSLENGGRECWFWKDLKEQV